MPNKKILLPIVALFSCAALASCGPTQQRDAEIEKIYNAYRANAQDKGEKVLSYDEWLASIKGEKGDKGDKGDQGDKGDKGDKGDNGQNGQNGNDGQPGDPGQPGDDGDDGASAYEIYKAAHPEYEGDEAQWMDDLVNGRLGNHEKVSVMYLTAFMDDEFNPDLRDDVEPSCVKVPGAVDLDDEKGFKLDLDAGQLAGRPGDPSIEGYMFEGWYVLGFKADGSAFYEPFNFSQTVVTGDMILVAKYSAKSYNVTIVCGDDESYDVQIKYGQIPAEVIPEEVLAPRGTKSFVGLFADSEFKYAIDLSEPYLFDRDYVVYAKYDDFAEDGMYVSTSAYDGDYNQFMFKFTKSGENIELFNIVSGSAYGSYEFVKFDEFNNLVFSKTDSSESVIVTPKDGSFSFIITEPKGTTEHYTKITGEDYWGYPGDFYGPKFDRETSMIKVTGKYVANEEFEADASEYTFYPGDSMEDNLFEHISFSEDASVKSFKLEVVEGSEDFFELDYYGYHVLTDKIGDASVILRDYDGNSIPLTIHNVEKTYITSIEILGEGIQDGEVTLEIGQTLQLSASYSMEGVNQKPNIKWSSNSSTKASVGSSTGLVTAKAVGDVTITVKDDAKPAPKVQKTLLVHVIKAQAPAELYGTWSFIGDDNYDGGDIKGTLSISSQSAHVDIVASGSSHPYDLDFVSTVDGISTFKENKSYYALTIKLSSSDGKVILEHIDDDGNWFYGDYYWVVETPQEMSAVQTYSLSIDSSIQNGSIRLVNPKSEGQVAAGSEVAFYPEAAEGYRLESVSVNDGAVEVSEKWDSSLYDYVKVFEMPEGDAVISASFAEITKHNLSKVSGFEEGRIVLVSPSVAGEVEVGSTVKFKVEAYEGYSLKKVFITGHDEIVISEQPSMTGTITYSFTMPDFDAEINAEFESSQPAPAFNWDTFNSSFVVKVNDPLSGKTNFRFTFNNGSVTGQNTSSSSFPAFAMSKDYVGCGNNQIHIYGDDEYSWLTVDLIIESSDGENFTVVADNSEGMPW